jgi:hypothetical protein
MKDYLISMFIDDELDLDEKIEFVETVHENRGYRDEAVELLSQEKLLRGDMVGRVPAVQVKTPGSFSYGWLRPLAALTAAVAMLAIFFLLVPRPVTRTRQATLERLPHRFVLYLPQARQAQLVGSFTHWRPVPMHKLDNSGYWVLTMELPKGEHRYSYLVENGKRIPDPTVLARERDDFGGENSIIEVRETT